MLRHFQAIYNNLTVFFYEFLSLYIKVFTDFCARYYEKNKENIQRKPCERYQNLTEEEKNKNMVTKYIKISWEPKKKV